MWVAAPTLELLEWVTARIRTYDDVREAWRSNCPRTAVWDDAVTDGLVCIDRRTDADAGVVVLTARGQAALDASLRGAEEGVLGPHERGPDLVRGPVPVSARYEMVSAAAPNWPRISPAGFFFV